MAVLLCLPATVFSDSAPSPVAQLYVRGEAQLMVPPDQVSVELGVTTESSKAKAAIANNSKKMNVVIQSLRDLGLTPRDYKTQNYRVQPIWSLRPKGADKNWRSSIVAYRVNNQLSVTTQELDDIGDLIGGATAAGANKVNSVRFSLLNERQYRDKAITQAVANAKQDAEILVAASGDSIKRTLSLNLDNTSASKVRVESTALKARSASMQADFSPPPIQSGDIVVRASVSITYELTTP
jgi:uncharacterized protein YggE